MSIHMWWSQPEIWDATALNTASVNMDRQLVTVASRER